MPLDMKSQKTPEWGTVIKSPLRQVIIRLESGQLAEPNAETQGLPEEGIAVGSKVLVTLAPETSPNVRTIHAVQEIKPPRPQPGWMNSLGAIPRAAFACLPR